jgi:hypothetical protein
VTGAACLPGDGLGDVSLSRICFPLRVACSVGIGDIAAAVLYAEHMVPLSLGLAGPRPDRRVLPFGDDISSWCRTLEEQWAIRR